MRLQLSSERKQRIDGVFEVAVIVAALATMPLTYAHMQEWDGPLLLVLDWAIWSVFAGEFLFAMAVAGNRRRTLRGQWFNLSIVVVSFPLLPHVLGLTRLLRLLRPMRLAGGLRIARPVHLLRLYFVRSAGSRRVMHHAKRSEHTRGLRHAIVSRLPGRGEGGRD